MSITENIAAIRREIDAAARESGRTGADITLVGASKMNDAAACQEAIAAGIDVLGENRVQEMTAKLAEHAYDGRPLHFIGHLQRNKVRQVVGKVALIQSVGSMELLREIEKEAAKQGLRQDILLEVNIGGEEAKSGFAPEDVRAAAQSALDSSKQRRQNLKNAFAVTEDLTGKQVLLVDDIFTTGTTCNECAKELYRAGAQKVFVCCLSAAGKLS